MEKIDDNVFKVLRESVKNLQNFQKAVGSISELTNTVQILNSETISEKRARIIREVLGDKINLATEPISECVVQSNSIDKQKAMQKLIIGVNKRVNFRLKYILFRCKKTKYTTRKELIKMLVTWKNLTITKK